MNKPRENPMNNRGWFNYKTKEWTDEPYDFSAMFEQQPVAVRLYELLTEHEGKTPFEAAKHILLIMAGETPE